MCETPHWSRGRVREVLSEEEGAGEKMCDELLQPSPPALLGRGSRVFGSKVKPGKKGGMGERHF